MSYRLLDEKEVVTRKRHGCVWCGKIIAKGDSAMRHAYIGEDGPSTDHFHFECWAAMKTHPDPSEISEGWHRGGFKRGTSDPA